MLASHEAKTDPKLYELLARDGWTIEPGEFIAIFETTIQVTFPPAIKVKIPPLTLTISENKNEVAGEDGLKRTTIPGELDAKV